MASFRVIYETRNRIFPLFRNTHELLLYARSQENVENYLREEQLREPEVAIGNVRIEKLTQEQGLELFKKLHWGRWVGD